MFFVPFEIKIFFIAGWKLLGLYDFGIFQLRVPTDPRVWFNEIDLNSNGFSVLGKE